MKIKKGDNVIVIQGKDKGKKGAVIQTFPRKDKVLVEGVNLRKSFQRSKEEKQAGKLVEFPYPIHISNIMIWDESAKKRSRIGSKTSEVGKKERVLKASLNIKVAPQKTSPISKPTSKTQKKVSASAKNTTSAKNKSVVKGK